jgi:hypothetical protein
MSAPDRAHDPRRRPNFRTFEDNDFNEYQGEGPQQLSDLPKEERDNYKWEKAAEEQLKNG